MKNPKRLSFRVVIEQEEPERERPFGPKEEWAKLIEQRLERALMVAVVAEVTPIRNRKAKP